MFFGVWKRENVQGNQVERRNSKKCVPLVWGVLRAIYSPDVFFKATTLQRPLASKGLWLDWSWLDWKYFDFLFLKMYRSWKSNGRIKSYGSRKFMVHWSVRHPSFCDISAVLTLILTHEQSLKWEFDNFRNGASFNPFWQLDQN